MEEISATIPGSATDLIDERDTDLGPAAVSKGDKHIWGIYIALCLISVIELYSASSREVASSSIGVFGPIVRHASMLLAGFVIMWAISRMHYRKLIKWTLLFSVVSVLLMVYVNFKGDIINGARRSVTIGIAIQPAEFIKLSAVLIVAWIMSRTQKRKEIGVENNGIIAAAIAILLFGGLLIKQGLTNTLLLMAISLSMMLIGGVQIKKFGIVLLVYIFFAGSYQALKPDDGENRDETWSARLERFFDPTPKYEQEIDAKNRQEMYAYMAQANGGVIGVFPGNSRETARLPLAFSDYIYSIIIEDLGLIGGVAVLILYLWLLARASGIASRCVRAYPALLVIGMAVMIVFQALFHMAIVTGVFPVSGQPLPLISKGGTSILITSIAFGIMLSVSRYAVRHNAKRSLIKEEGNALPEDMRAENPTQL